jgi:hypothetical protein
MTLVQHPMKWIDPKGIKDKEAVTLHVAVTREYAHKLVNNQPIHSAGLEHTDGKDWEMFTAHTRGRVDGQEYIWGSFWEGLGLVDVMVKAEDSRELSQEEKKFWSGRAMAMVGSHTGKQSYGFKCPDLT